MLTISTLELVSRLTLEFVTMLTFELVSRLLVHRLNLGVILTIYQTMTMNMITPPPPEKGGWAEVSLFQHFFPLWESFMTPDLF